MESIVPGVISKLASFVTASLATASSIARIACTFFHTLAASPFLAAQSLRRHLALNVWSATRERWVAAERPAIAARQLFERVHTLWTTMQREGDRVELVLSDGMLHEETQLIRHPVLLQRINFEFNPAVPEFRSFHGN
jgi:hypothetical protein